MRRAVLAIATVAAAALAGCRASTPPKFPDAPIELADDTDRDQAIDRMIAMPAGPARAAARTAIATAIAHRLGEAIDDDHPFAAAGLLAELAGLWQAEPAAVGRELAAAGGVEVVRRARAMFAKSGALDSAITAIALLVEIDPAARAAHTAELAEALAFADDLAVAENGANAERAQPIALLAPTVLALPLPWLVDRYVQLLEDRQRAVVAVIARDGATPEIVRAHHDILATSRRIAIALARAGRAPQIAAHLVELSGLGAEPQLVAVAESVSSQPTAAAYVELATALRTDEHAADDTAALATCMTGLASFPNDVALLELAGDLAAGLGRIAQPIALYEAAVVASKQHGNDREPVLALRLGKLYAARIAQLAATGRPHAATEAWHALEHAPHVAGSARVDHAWAQVAATGEAALGKGLATQGRIDDAEAALHAALARAPTVDAYETLATVDYQLGRLVPAQREAAAGITALGDGSDTGYQRARLERLSADIQRRGGDAHGAAELYLDALRSWAGLGDARELPSALAAERLLESGRAMWFLGDPKRAVSLVLGAVDTDADAPDVTTGAVAFLIEIGHYTDALDAYHRGLGADALTEDDKIYTSLWMLAEARRRGEHGDRIAIEYLTQRRGDLWYEQLAEAATGRRELASLRVAANTAPRRAELAYYGAVLGLDPAARTEAGARKLLGEVVDARIVMDAEYDLARLYLGPAEPVPTPADRQ